MRAFAVACVVAVGTVRVADAKRVIMRPSIARSCGAASAWETIRTCVARFGKPTVVQSKGEMHLLHVKPQHGEIGVEGYYLYVRRKGEWRLGGMLQGEGYKIESARPYSFAKRQIWRIDASYAGSDDIATDGSTLRHALVRGKVSAFCAGDYASCAIALTSCDVFVSGKLLYSFRGTLEVKDDVMRVKGDRSRALDRCSQEEELFIPLPESADGDFID